MKRKVLFICIHNSARSQMAEAWLNYLCPDYFEAQSAGLEPGTLNPLVVDAMAEAGLDISRKVTRRVHDVWQLGTFFDYVITVCDAASAERCPVFPGHGQKLHWSFPDPSTLSGSREEQMQRVRQIRDDIRRKIESWCGEVCLPQP